MTGPAVSVVICAYTERRWPDLVAAVASIREQDRPAAEILLVVDHNPSLAARARVVLSDVAVRESPRRRGLSGARNTALDHATGDIVVFIDDDACARPDWLAQLVAPYADPSTLAVGGLAVPRWPSGEAPAVLPPELWWIVGCSFTGQHPASTGEGVVDVRNVMGCSMSFRRSVLVAVGGFAEDMGRVGATPLGCEETDVCIRLRQRHPEGRIVLTPAGVVDHRVGADRVGWGYLLRRSWSEGVSKAVLARRVGAADGLSTERSYVLEVLPGALRRELRCGARAWIGGQASEAGRRGSAAAAVVLALAATAAGYLRGRVGRRRRSR
ncbi:glycosyltransferase family 2 protein [Actinomycetospora aeridis]|uniref:Glycosyltransferase family 2 protein n=1 Tax=Actinomycetospora aeridis TaxID=3129231 RepID=A0ABU8NEC0_9PSEU